MTGEVWQILLGLLGFFGVVVAVVIRLSTNYLKELREDIKATKDLDVKVGQHTTEIQDILRRLTLLEGGIKEVMAGMDRRLTDLNNSVIRLEAGLKFTDQIRGLIGKRFTDGSEG